MSLQRGSTIWRVAKILALVLLVFTSTDRVTSLDAATPPCPEGSEPVAAVDLAAVLLPDDAPPGATLVLSRLTLAPDEARATETGEYAAWFVESGLLKFEPSPRGTGFHLEHPGQCISATGEFRSGGTTSFDENGWMVVDAGTAVVADDRPIEWIGNAGDTPLELLQITLLLPELDPGAGEPVGDQLATDIPAAQQQRQRERQERRDERDAERSGSGTPVATVLPGN